MRYRNLEERLLYMSVLNSATGCWEWLGRRVGEYGYPRINLYCRRTRRTVTHWAHRVSYETFVGPVPEGLQVHHHCVNPSCINPGHLEAVTPVENTRYQSRVRRKRTT